MKVTLTQTNVTGIKISEILYPERFKFNIILHLEILFIASFTYNIKSLYSLLTYYFFSVNKSPKHLPICIILAHALVITNVTLKVLEDNFQI